VSARRCAGSARGPHRQRGTTSVEFALVGAVLFIVLFGVIELGRMMFARTVLEEGVRRAARLAAVCPINDGAITDAATFTGTGGADAILPDFTAANVRLEYLGANGAALGNPAGSFALIRYVRVTIQNYQIPVLVPFLQVEFVANNVSSTLPAESLGVSPTAITPC
jgi:Flp pilus assembly protein TadG